jgi:hypothetical protein
MSTGGAASCQLGQHLMLAAEGHTRLPSSLPPLDMRTVLYSASQHNNIQQELAYQEPDGVGAKQL